MKKKLFSQTKFWSLRYLFAILLTSLCIHSNRAQETVLLQNSGQFIVPCGVNEITVEAIGGGGSGGTRNSNGNAAGGGGGAYAKKTLAVNPGQIFNYTIGQGGYDPNNLNRDGFQGGSTIFGDNLVVAEGGYGGTHAGSASSIGGNGGQAVNSIGDVVYNGGKGGNGGVVRANVDGTLQSVNAYSGAGGGAAGSTGVGGNATTFSAGLGTSDLGGSGAPGVEGLVDSNGQAGYNYGGGGAGALRIIGGSRMRGGAGADGVIRVTYTKVLQTYCSSLIASNNIRPITQVTINDLNNTSNPNATATHETFCNVVNLTQGATNILTVKINTRGNNTQRFTAFVDWNQDGDFNDANETFTTTNTIVNSSGLDAASASLNIVVPYTATIGLTTLRIVSHNTTTTTPCASTSTLGQIEDYVINVIEAEPCVTPTTQPSTLILSANSNSLSGIFYESFPIPNSYLVVYSRTQSATPTITDGTFYTVGQQIGSGYYVASNDASTSFTTTTNIVANATYRVWIFAYNQYCVGGPKYNRNNPTFSSINNTTNTYCIGNMRQNQFSQNYLTRVAFVGIINETTNTSTYSSNPRGYQDFTGLANFPIQERGAGVNISIQNSELSVTQAWVDWNKNGRFDNNERVYTSGGTSIISTTFGFIIPANQAIGQYRVRIKIASRSGFSSCSDDYIGETEDYLLTVIEKCNSEIVSVVNGEQCGAGQVQIGAHGNANTTRYIWYTSETGGAPIATTTSNTWSTPHISQTTTFWVASANNNCESRVRKPVVAKISPLANITFFPENPVVCGENDMIRLTANGDTETVYLVNETFNDNTFGTLIKGYIQGNLSSSYRQLKEFKIYNSPMVPNYNVWFPAISSGETGDKFILSNSDSPGSSFDHFISTQSLNTNNFNSLYFSVRMFFSRYKDDNVNESNEYVAIQVSPTGQTANNNWITIQRFSEDVGIGTRFKTLNYDVSEYINLPNVKFRIIYNGAYTDGLALDDIKVWGIKPLETSFEWYNSSNVNAFIDAQGTIPYVEGTRTVALYVKPAYSQLSLDSFQFTATALLSNGCLTSKDITVGNKTKIWTGTASNNWDNNNNWLPLGRPTIENCVIVDSESKITGNSYDAFARNLVVKTSGDLEVQSENNIIIDEFLKVDPNGTMNIRDKAALVQNKENFTNSGNVTIERRTPEMNKYGVNFWGSPLTQNSNFTLGNLIPNVNYRYSFDLRTWGTDGHFVRETAATVMQPAKGYILEVPLTFPAQNSGNRQSYLANFIGTPNNGAINIPLYTTTRPETVADYSELNNLISNPYPSAIDASKIIFDTRNSGKVDGTLYIWANFSGISPDVDSPYYNPDYNQNYSKDDYIVMNIAGSVHPINPNLAQTSYQYISSGQGFFIKSLANNNTIVIDNSMRVKNENDVFYKNENKNSNGLQTEYLKKEIAKDEFKQIWIDLHSNNKPVAQTLIGYHNNATNEYDNGLDSKILGLKTSDIYSINQNIKLAIQTRNSFDENEIVPLGVILDQSGDQTIKLARHTEHFKNVEVILIDKELNKIHDLKLANYNFKANKGKYEDRFEIRFKNIIKKQQNTNSIQVFNITNFMISSKDQPIQAIDVFDSTGKLIKQVNNLNQNEYQFNYTKSNSTYLLHIKLADGSSEKIKTIF